MATLSVYQANGRPFSNGEKPVTEQGYSQFRPPCSLSSPPQAVNSDGLLIEEIFRGINLDHVMMARGEEDTLSARKAKAYKIAEEILRQKREVASTKSWADMVEEEEEGEEEYFNSSPPESVIEDAEEEGFAEEKGIKRMHSLFVCPFARAQWEEEKEREELGERIQVGQLMPGDTFSPFAYALECLVLYPIAEEELEDDHELLGSSGSDNSSAVAEIQFAEEPEELPLPAFPNGTWFEDSWVSLPTSSPFPSPLPKPIIGAAKYPLSPVVSDDGSDDGASSDLFLQITVEGEWQRRRSSDEWEEEQSSAGASSAATTADPAEEEGKQHQEGISGGAEVAPVATETEEVEIISRTSPLQQIRRDAIEVRSIVVSSPDTSIQAAAPRRRAGTIRQKFIGLLQMSGEFERYQERKLLEANRAIEERRLLELQKTETTNHQIVVIQEELHLKAQEMQLYLLQRAEEKRYKNHQEVVVKRKGSQNLFIMLATLFAALLPVLFLGVFGFIFFCC